MKKRLNIEFSTCLDCPYCRLVKRIEDSRGDLWMCHHDPVSLREIIEDKAIREFASQYPKSFPSCCPLPTVEGSNVEPEEPQLERDGTLYKWQLHNPEHYDLSRAVIYLADNHKSWRLFAIRASTKRATDASYDEYPSFDKVIERFDNDYGVGSQWEKQPLKVSKRKSIF